LKSSSACFLHVASFYFILKENEVNLENNPKIGYDKLYVFCREHQSSPQRSRSPFLKEIFKDLLSSSLKQELKKSFLEAFKEINDHSLYQDFYDPLKDDNDIMDELSTHLGHS
jgi:hypothetical protein